MKKISVQLSNRGYDIIITFNKIDKLGDFIGSLDIGKDAVIITNNKIKKLFGKRIEGSLISSGFNVRFEIVPDTEKAKSEKIFSRLINNIAGFDNSKRKIFIISLGGGVIGDLAGFLASVYRRGIPYIQVPTTLLAQVDSAIGGKVGIDLKSGKNLVGSFYQPRLVFSDVSLLKNLPQKDLISGMAEVIKYGIIKSPELFNYVEKNYTSIINRDKTALEYIIYMSSKIKAQIIEKDELDTKNIRVILNLGHTIGHAIETSAHYNRLYSHGQAIALGLLSASFISRYLHILDEEAFLRIKLLIEKIGFSTSLKNLKVESIYKAQEHDKKFIYGRNRFVLPVRIGKTIVKENIHPSLIKKSIVSLYEDKNR